MSIGTDIPFGRILSGLMKQRDLRIADVAEMARVSKSVVHGWMTGTSPRDLTAVKRLSDALGISFSELLLGEKDKSMQIVSFIETDSVPFFDGYCRLRIEKVIPKN